MEKRLKIVTILLLLTQMAVGQVPADGARTVEKMMSQMTLRQKVAQLMVVRVPLNMDDKGRQRFCRLVADNEVGGVCFFAGFSKDQYNFTTFLQKEAKQPLLVCIDGETGIGFRMKDVTQFPCQMLLGALPAEADSLIEAMGDEMGRQCASFGVHVNFAPVVDLNTNPRNPVIGRRSLGEDKYAVARKAACLVRGMQNQNVMAVAKHFPGHGDTETDSHLTLPVEGHSSEYIDSVNLYPFRSVIGQGIGGVMVAHLYVPALEINSEGKGGQTKSISSLSPDIVQHLLREKMQFGGLIFTDGLDMKAVTNSYGDGEASLKAMLAGCDALLLPDDVEDAIDRICQAADDDASLIPIIDEHCRRVLESKQRWNIHPMEVQDIENEVSRMNERTKTLSLQIAQRGVTLLRDDTVLACAESASRKLPVRIDVTSRNLDAMMHRADSLPDSVPLVVTLYDTPYLLDRLQPCLDTLQNPLALIVAYENSAVVRQTVDSLVAAALRAPFAHSLKKNQKEKMLFHGRLPVKAGRYSYGAGLTLTPVNIVNQVAVSTLRQSQPHLCDAIDSLVVRGIRSRAYPGCQLLVAKNGEVVYSRAYGSFTYDTLLQLDSGAIWPWFNGSENMVTPDTRYDVASVTKVAATTLALMRLVDEGRIKTKDRLSKYLPYLKHTNKSHITIREVMSHCARLKSGEKMWAGCDLRGTLLPDSTDRALKIIAHDDLLKEKNKYLYSDLGFILLGDLVRRVAGVPLDQYVDSCFYRPLGMSHTTFNPLQHGVPRDSVAPTEYDLRLRGGLVQGTVHDPNAAAMGGVAGHAGLFTTATDLAKLFQMLLDGGVAPDGTRLLSEKVIEEFNHRYFEKQGNRRALGFDKPLFHPVANGNTAISVTQSSYGHTGFTGTMVWVDPEAQLLYIFLSNRVCPNTTPNKLSSMNIRTDIQELLYQIDD